MNKWVNELIDKYYEFLKERTSVITSTESDWIVISTPFIGLFNDMIEIYVKKENGKIVLSDDGVTLKNIELLGPPISRSPKRKDLFENILLIYGVQLHGDELMIEATENNFAQKTHNLISAISEINDMYMTDKHTVASIEFSRKGIHKIDSLYKSIPSPQKTIVAGVIDEMKFSREQVILTTTDKKKIVVVVNKSMFQELKEYFGKEVAIIGMAHFKMGGQFSYVKMERFSEANERLIKLFSKKPQKMDIQQQIALQLCEGKKRNPLPDIIGKWPGDESLDELLQILKELD